MFYVLYFWEKPILDTLIEDKTEPIMYLCLLISFGSSFYTSYSLGYFNKENIKKMTSMEEFEK